MNESDLINKAKEFATELLGTDQLKEYSFHNIKHTEKVVQDAEIIAKACQLNQDQIDTVLIAAWLHDTGYRQGAEGHEQRSSENAKKLLKESGASDQKIADVIRTIMATKMPQNPKDIMGEVLCDADLAHLGAEDFQACGKELREELSRHHNMSFENDEDWFKFNLRFLEKHQYFTDYGKRVLDEGKHKNIKRLQKLIKGEKKDRKDLEKEIDNLKKKIAKSPESDRGVETILKLTSQNHVTLSGMADNKSNIMISISTIILSVIVSMLFTKIEEHPMILVPTLMLVFTCLAAIIFAILATRPSIARGTFTTEDIQQRKTNLLFFGNFHRSDLDSYEWGMREMMKDSDYLYGSMIKDIYFLGKVVAKKYQLLRLSYTIFMFGFVASMIGFILAMIHPSYLAFLFHF